MDRSKIVTKRAHSLRYRKNRMVFKKRLSCSGLKWIACVTSKKLCSELHTSNDLHDGDKVEDHQDDDSNGGIPLDRRGVPHRYPVKLVLALVVAAILSRRWAALLELPAVVPMDRRCRDRWPSRSDQHAHKRHCRPRLRREHLSRKSRPDFGRSRSARLPGRGRKRRSQSRPG